MKIICEISCRVFSALFLSAVLLIQVSTASHAQSNGIWKYACQKRQGSNICQIQQQLFVQKEVDGKQKTVGRLVSAIVQKRIVDGAEKIKLSLWLPLGTNLQAGIKVLVDSGKQYQLPFAQCTTEGCLVSAFIPSDFLQSMKMGKKLRVGFLSYGGKKPLVAEVSLKGFTKQFSKL